MRKILTKTEFEYCDTCFLFIFNSFFKIRHWLKTIVFSEPMVVTLSGLGAQKHFSGEPSILGL